MKLLEVLLFAFGVVLVAMFVSYTLQTQLPKQVVEIFLGLVVLIAVTTLLLWAYDNNLQGRHVIRI